ncbi:CGNR zinc finger domain-containing protein [soil metagenome]
MSLPFVWHDHHFITGVHGLDFANTIVWRHDLARRVDRIQSRGDLSGWMKAAGLAPEPSALAQSLVSRMAIDRYFRDHDKRAWAELAGCYAQALATRPHGSLAAILHSAMALAFSPEAGHVKVCENCGWLFIDRTRNGNKRWCTPNLCGARTRAKRYYERVRSEVARKAPS